MVQFLYSEVQGLKSHMMRVDFLLPQETVCVVCYEQFLLHNESVLPVVDDVITASRFLLNEESLSMEYWTMPKP